MDITIERNLHLQLLSRSGYTVLDYLSDVGGVHSIMISLAFFLVSCQNYNSIENFMVTKLYQFEPSSQGEGNT